MHARSSISGLQYINLHMCKSLAHKITSTSTIVLEYIKGNSHGHDLLHLEQDLELRGAFLPFATPCYGSAIDTKPYDTGLEAPFAHSLHSVYFCKSTLP